MRYIDIRHLVTGVACQDCDGGGTWMFITDENMIAGYACDEHKEQHEENNTAQRRAG